MENGLMICLDEIKFKQVLYLKITSTNMLFSIFYTIKKSTKEKKSKIQEDIHEESLEDCPSCGEGPK
jgi:hypothetical protein